MRNPEKTPGLSRKPHLNRGKSNVSSRIPKTQREKYFEYELTRLSRMVIGQRQIYQSLKYNKLANSHFDSDENEPFWSDPEDLKNSYMADQRALMVLYALAETEGIIIKEWLEQLVLNAVKDPPRREEVKQKIEKLIKRQKESSALIKSDRNKEEKETVKKSTLTAKSGKEETVALLKFSCRYGELLSDFISIEG